MFSRPELNRGKTLFTNKLAEAREALTKDQQYTLDILRMSFEAIVAVMETTDDQGRTTAYAAQRMANACIEAAQSQNTQATPAELISYVVKQYQGGSRDITTGDMDPAEHRRKTLALSAAITANDISNLELDEGTGIMIDNIDLIKTIRKEDLTLEGKRARGILPANFDTESDVAPEEMAEEAGLPQGLVLEDANGEMVVYCPDCKVDDVYSIGVEQFGCFKCDKEFTVDMNLGDRLSEQAQTPQIIRYGDIQDGIKRVNRYRQ